MSNDIKEKDWSKFIDLLEDQYEFPCRYLFKFVVSLDHKDRLVEILEEGEIGIKESSGGKYISVTCRYHVTSANEIIDIYEKVKMIPGLISL